MAQVLVAMFLHWSLVGTSIGAWLVHPLELGWYIHWSLVGTSIMGNNSFFFTKLFEVF